MAAATATGTLAVSAFAGASLGFLDLGQGRPQAAIEHLEQVAATFERGRVAEPGILWWTADLVEAHTRVGDIGAARRRLEVFQAQARSPRSWAAAPPIGKPPISSSSAPAPSTSTSATSTRSSRSAPAPSSPSASPPTPSRFGRLMTRLDGSTMLVTGAARGMGRQLCVQAAGRGARIVAWDLDGSGLEALASELGDSLVSRSVVDVTSVASVAAGSAAIEGGPDAVEIVVNNAGVVSGDRLVDLRPEQIERTFAVNVLALYWVTQAFLPSMQARGRGHVVTMASAAGLVGVARQTDYSASKHAAVGFMESLRAELRRDKIGVSTTTVCPFYIDTGMFEGAKSRIPWLLPILHEPDVAAKILRAIERDKPLLRLPPLVATLPLARILPTPVFDRVMDLLGVNRSMDAFTGRKHP